MQILLFKEKIESSASAAELTVPYILTQMAAIQNDTAHIQKALEALIDSMHAHRRNPQAGVDQENGQGGIVLGPGAVMSQDPESAAADAINRIVVSRETTNQQLLRMYEGLLRHLLPDMAPGFMA